MAAVTIYSDFGAPQNYYVPITMLIPFHELVYLYYNPVKLELSLSRFKGKEVVS